MQQKLTREERMEQLYAAHVRPVKIASHAWEVPGSNGRQYQVEELSDGTYNCTCPDALYRSHQGEMCKHVLLVRKCAHKATGIIEIHDDVHNIHMKREVVVVF